MHRVCAFSLCWFFFGVGFSAEAQEKDPNCGAPNLMLVVDTSGSMTQAGKIASLKDAISDAVNLFKEKLRFGLISFSNGQAVYRVAVGPKDLKKEAASHAQKVIAAALALKALGDTPMTQAMRLALKKFKEDVIPPDLLHKVPDVKTKRRSYVLLMTDGEPTDGNPREPIKALRALQVGPKLYDIKTFVVGLGAGQEIRAFQLNEYAKVGGTKKFFHATRKQDLIDIFKQIAKDVSKQTELCNGRDDDCDGVVDEDIRRDCKSKCGDGVEVCHKGKWGKCNAPEVQKELCDGHDNDCDNQIDEGLKRDCSTSCGRGEQSCIHGDWSTCSAPRPEPEVCDGKDNDCNGKVDDGLKVCPGGKCVKDGVLARCEILCEGSECPSGFLCVQSTGKCRELPCRRHRCPAGQICTNTSDFKARCSDPCAAVKCGTNETCGRGGRCINCYTSACVSGMVCMKGRCTIDKCVDMKCGEGQGCRNGICFDVCAKKQCKEGQICQTLDANLPRGVCIAAPCFGVNCEKGEACVGGRCVENKCIAAAAKDCGKRVCDPVTGECKDDPCGLTHCPEGNKCFRGECVSGEGQEPTSRSECQEDVDCGGSGYVCKNAYCVSGAGVQGGSCRCVVVPGGDIPVEPLLFFLCFFIYRWRVRRRLFRSQGGERGVGLGG